MNVDRLTKNEFSALGDCFIKAYKIPRCKFMRQGVELNSGSAILEESVKLVSEKQFQ